MVDFSLSWAKSKLSSFREEYVVQICCVSRIVSRSLNAVVYFSQIKHCTGLALVVMDVAVCVIAGSVLIQLKAIFDSWRSYSLLKIPYNWLDIIADFFTAIFAFYFLVIACSLIFHLHIINIIVLLLWALSCLSVCFEEKISLKAFNFAPWISSTILFFLTLIYFKQIFSLV